MCIVETTVLSLQSHVCLTSEILNVVVTRPPFAQCLGGALPVHCDFSQQHPQAASREVLHPSSSALPGVWPAAAQGVASGSTSLLPWVQREEQSEGQITAWLELKIPK